MKSIEAMYALDKRELEEIMNSKTVKVSELTENQLDWVVTKIEKPTLHDMYPSHMKASVRIGYSSDWAQGGAIIEREGVCLYINTNGLWEAWLYTFGTDGEEVGRNEAETPLIAAMRCYVSSRLGDEVELPEELK